MLRGPSQPQRTCRAVSNHSQQQGRHLFHINFHQLLHINILHPPKLSAPSPCSLLQVNINPACPSVLPGWDQGSAEQTGEITGGNWCLSTPRLMPDKMIHEVMLKNDDKNNLFRESVVFTANEIRK